jgi:hypothetical protein
MAERMTPELWYELRRVAVAWYVIDSNNRNCFNFDRVKKLDELTTLGFVKTWEYASQGQFYGITEQGQSALKLHTFEN